MTLLACDYYYYGFEQMDEQRTEETENEKEKKTVYVREIECR